MPIREKTTFRGDELDGSAEVEGLLAQIQEERIPERLLVLAQTLQQALNLRKDRWSQDIKNVDPI